MLVFTVGRKDAYDHNILGDGSKKIGRVYALDGSIHYSGGTIWMMRQGAEDWLNSQIVPRHIDFGQGPVECDVYGVRIQGLEDLADEDDPYRKPGDRSLLITRPLELLEPLES